MSHFDQRSNNSRIKSTRKRSDPIEEPKHEETPKKDEETDENENEGTDEDQNDSQTNDKNNILAHIEMSLPYEDVNLYLKHK